jgi:hypothetical protein
VIVLAILAVWSASMVPVFLIGVGVGRDDERARDWERAQLRAAVARCERSMT